MLQEIIVDSFAGGGGASTGIELALQALGYDDAIVDFAINHNGAALAMHEVNHPGTVHMEADIWTVDPRASTKGKPVGLLWTSPDCTQFSRAKGGTPVSAKIRGLAWSVANWAEQVSPRVILLENVEEFLKWGPLMPHPTKPNELIADPSRAGETFKAWSSKFRKLGYKMEWRILKACDYGAPTIRRRLHIIMRRDGEKIVWPAPTHGNPNSHAVKSGKLLPWRTAAEIIDWWRPTPSILMSRDDAREYTRATGQRIKRPLEYKTMVRIAAGVLRYVLEAAKPFVVTCNHAGPNFRGESLDEPFVTVTKAWDAHGLAVPTLATFITSYYGETVDGRNDRAAAIDESIRTIATQPRHGVVEAAVAPFMAAHYSNDVGSPADAPTRTITGTPKVEPVAAQLHLPPLTEEQMASARKVAAFLREHDAWDDREFVTVGDYVMVDIGMRMLTPRELARAQGFPEDYVLAAPHKGGVLSETDQRHKIGNSVCPPVAAAIVAANYRPQLRTTIPADQGWLFEGEAA